MTQLPLMDVETEQMPLPVGSHQVSRDGSKVIVHRVPIFAVGDTGPDKLGEVDSDRLREILDASNERAGSGAFPRVIEGHNRAGLEHEPESVGRLLNLRIESGPAGEDTIYAEMEVDQFYFESAIASNRYPRRSAEIMKDSLALTEVALLGSNTPALPLEDTHFSSGSERVALYQSDLEPTEFQPKIGDNDMASFSDEQKAELAQLVSESVKSAFEASKGKAQDEEEEEEDMEDEEKDENECKGKSKSKNESADEKVNFAAVKAELDVQKARADRAEAAISQLREQGDQEYVSEKLKFMKSVGGFTSIDIEEESKRLLSMPSRDTMDTELKRIEAHYARDINAAVILDSASVPRHHIQTADSASKITQDQIDKAKNHALKEGVSVKAAMADLYPAAN